MPNPYDKAHELASVIEQDENYIKVKDLSEKVMTNKDHMMLIDTFRRKQYEIHQKQMQGIQLEQDELEEANKLYESLSKYPKIMELLQAEEKLSILFSDINRILTASLEKIYKKED